MTDVRSTLIRTGGPLEVLLAFARLGVSSFGGPIAHIGYFRQEFVIRRRWLDEQAYADIVAVCQFLPGPTSSQVGFSLGLMRAGYTGGLAAWAGFTLPSAVAMTLFAFGASAFAGSIATGLLHGLKIVAVSVVAQAVLGMARALCPDRERASIATIAALLCIAAPIGQLAAIAAGGVAGLWLCRSATGARATPLAFPVSKRAGVIALTVFALLLAGLPLLRGVADSQAVALFEAFYRSGALVFGGGHVVLPLLQEAVVRPGWVSDDLFLAGYGAAQAIPGPLFTFAAYLGAVARGSLGGLGGAALSLVAIFLPGILVLIGTLPFWGDLRGRVGAQAAMHGVNAAVVGVLAAALYSPLWTSSIGSARDFGVALLGFVLLTVWRAPPLLVVAVGAASGALLALL